MTKDAVRLVVVGSIGLDDIATPAARRQNVLGGSATYACTAASIFTRPGLAGVAGRDFPKRHLSFYRRQGFDLRGLEIADGATFRWSGEYEADMNRRRTLKTELNVLGAFNPVLPEAFRRAPYLFLANMQPGLQLRVLEQMRAPRFVAVDTMDLWIHTARAELEAVWKRADLVTLNDAEARQYAGETELLRAARRVLARGPRYVVIKKGEHGAMWISARATGLLPAYPVEKTRDPTGAGDAFAGGMMGALARAGRADEPSVRRAMFHGAVAASFCVEAFGPAGLARRTAAAHGARMKAFLQMIHG